MKSSEVKLLSIVSPVYKGVGTIERLCEEITTTLNQINMKFEILLVDDASPDNSWEVISQLSKKDSRIRGLQLSRNSGQHHAITAGVDHANGDWVAVIDCDLEDHPRYLNNMIETMDQGYNVVFARRIGKKHSLFKKICSYFYTKIFNSLTGFHHDSAVGTFTLMDEKVVDAYRQYREAIRVHTHLIYQVGFRLGYCDIKHESRYAGESNYNLIKNIALFIQCTLLYTEKPLIMISVVGLGISMAALLFVGYHVFSYFYFGGQVVGWTSLIASIYLMAGIIILAIGINGLYLGKAFREGMKRPLYHIRNKL